MSQDDMDCVYISEQRGKMFSFGEGSGREWMVYDGPAARDVSDFR